MEAEATLSNEDRKRLDRQRFIGWETQRKLISSRVLIAPANGSNIELAKNLILAGVNISIFDDAIVNEDDFQSNFLIARADIGKKRGEAVYQKLKHMNPTGKNEYFDENLLENVDKYEERFFKRFTILATSTPDFTLASKWDKLSKKLNIPYYNLVCCGLHAFVYISLGQLYQYKQINKTTKSVTKIWEVESFSLEEALKVQSSGKRRKDPKQTFMAAIIMMSKAESQGLKIDPFAEQIDEVTLAKIVDLGNEIMGNQNDAAFFRTFATTFGIDYVPVYSVIGSIVSQEIIKIAQNQSEPGMNWLIFNSEQGYANIMKLPSQSTKITSRIPNESA